MIQRFRLLLAENPLKCATSEKRPLPESFESKKIGSSTFTCTPFDTSDTEKYQIERTFFKQKTDKKIDWFDCQALEGDEQSVGLTCSPFLIDLSLHRSFDLDFLSWFVIDKTHRLNSAIFFFGVFFWCLGLLNSIHSLIRGVLGRQVYSFSTQTRESGAVSLESTCIDRGFVSRGQIKKGKLF